MKRYGMLIRVKPERLEEYKEIHRHVWPEVLDTIKKCNIQNYSIYFKDGMLFAYYEYVGVDYKADLAKMAADPKTQAWWKITDPMQIPLEPRVEGQWWANLEEVFHVD
jgi:L-rhamnose mutarotase